MKNYINYILLFLFVVLISCKQKEDLSSFAVMNSKIEESVENSTIINATLLDVIYSKAKNDDDFIQFKETADKVHEISTIFSTYLEDLKTVIKDKNTTEFVDEYFFNGNEIANGGDEFLNYIENYKSSLISTVALLNPSISGMVKSTFNIGSIEDRKGKQTNWLTLNYKSFPPISSIIKLSEMQSNVKRIEKNFHESILNVKLKNVQNNQSELSNTKEVAINTLANSNKIKQELPKTEIPNTTATKEEKKDVEPAKKVEELKKEVKPIKKETDFSLAKVHTVAKGETLYQISKKYKLTTTLLKKMNGLTNNNLVVGQKLKVKK